MTYIGRDGIEPDRGPADEDAARRQERDPKGRFREGTSGNPRGRPRKPPRAPWTLHDRFVFELSQEVYVNGPDGTAEAVLMKDLIVKSLVRSIPKARPKEQLAIVRELRDMGAFDTPSQDEESVYTSEEDRRLFAAADEILRSMGLRGVQSSEVRSLDDDSI